MLCLVPSVSAPGGFFSRPGFFCHVVSNAGQSILSTWLGHQTCQHLIPTQCCGNQFFCKSLRDLVWQICLMLVQDFASIGLGLFSNDPMCFSFVRLFVLSFLSYKKVQVRFIVMLSYLSQGEAGPPSEKELVSNAVQQVIAPTGTVYFMLLIILDTLLYKCNRVYK